MTVERSERLAPTWRTVHSEHLQRDIQVRRPTVGDALADQATVWARLCRDGDGTPLLPAGMSPGEADADLAAEVVALATARPTSPLGSPG